MNDLRTALRRSWHVFLGRFPRPTEVQERAIPEILAGRDVLITAPTASGKTEAFAAPAGELACAITPRTGLAVLVVSPTRALANDLYRRLDTRFEDLGVSFGRYTGEHKDRRSGGGLPEIAIATPEALDSLLARRATALESVRLVILDEIHILDGTVRGDHLRILLHRLQRCAAHPPQRVAVSATVDDPVGLAGRYLRDASIVTVAGQRALRVRSFEGSDPFAVCAHVDELARSGLRKILVFCNRRAAVELVTRALREASRFRDVVFPHHGSLSQSVRERTEAQFQTAPAAVAVATMTLEIGIDIGSVDYVLLVGLPHGIPALLQRIGRGNRRTQHTRAGYTIDSPGQAILAERMFIAARDGRLLGPPYGLRPGVMAQQALVIAAARDWVDAQRLRQAVPDEVWEDAAPAEPQALLETLAEAGHLERTSHGRFVAGDAIDERYVSGMLHSNLADEPSVDVIDRISGEVIGRVEPPEHNKLHVGGDARKVVKVGGKYLLTDATRSNDAPPRFVSRGVPLTSFALARDVVRCFPTATEPVLARHQIAVFRCPPHLVVLHGLGSLGSLLFADLVSSRYGMASIVNSTAFGTTLSIPAFELPGPPPDRFEGFLSSQELRLTRLCAVGPWHEALPQAVRLAALRRIVDADGLHDFLAGAQVLLVDIPPHVAEAWGTLA